MIVQETFPNNKRNIFNNKIWETKPSKIVGKLKEKLTLKTPKILADDLNGYQEIFSLSRAFRNQF